MHDIRFIQPFSIERAFEKKFGNSQKHLKNHGRSARLVFGLVGDVVVTSPFFCHCFVAYDNVYSPRIVQSFSTEWPKIKIYSGAFWAHFVPIRTAHQHHWRTPPNGCSATTNQKRALPSRKTPRCNCLPCLVPFVLFPKQWRHCRGTLNKRIPTASFKMQAHTRSTN